MKGNTVNILLVEDDEVDVMNVRRAFEKNHVTNPLHVANNGVEALAMLRGNGVAVITPQPKILLVDLNMPKMNGIELLTELRSDPKLKALTVFVLTTSDDDRDKVAAYNLNVAGYVLKPIGWSSFMEAISTLNLYWSLIEV